MRRPTRLLTLLVVAGAVLLTTFPASADTPGTGGVNVDRLPWLAGERRQLTQGWFGHASHYGQFGEDWTKWQGGVSGGTAIPFYVLAVAEGEATCHNRTDPDDPSGEYVWVERSTAGPTWDWTDWYFHLDVYTCESVAWPRHVEQGDVLAIATGSGSDLVHLHYEPRNGPGPFNSVNHCESGICNFCDHSDWGLPDSHDGEIGFQCAEGHSDGPLHGADPADEWYVSDNAGPGLNASFTWVRDRIWFSYYAAGHYGPDCQAGEQAWDCVGSSIQLVPGYGPMAFPYTHHGDPAWHQWFLAPDGVWHGMNLPNACSIYYAYVVPGDYFIAWFFNADQLGEACSSVNCIPYYGCIQSFRYGALWSNAYGQNPIVLPPEYGSSTCGE